MEPRPRAFMISLFHEMSGLTVDDLYSMDSDINGQIHLEGRLLKQITKLQAKVDSLRELAKSADAEEGSLL